MGAGGIEVAAHDGRDLATLQVYPAGTTMTGKLLEGFTLNVDKLFEP